MSGQQNKVMIGGPERSRYMVLLWKLKVLVIIALAGTAVLAFFVLKKEHPMYFATTVSGKVQQIYALSQPIVTDQYLLSWSESRVRSMFSLNFGNFDHAVASLQNYFTSSGFSSYTASLVASGFKASIQGQKLSLSSVVSGAAVILRQGVLLGRYTWMISMPMMMELESASVTKTERFNVVLKVGRVPVLDAPLGGIQIMSIAVTKRI